MKQQIISGLKKKLLLVERDGVLLQTWRDIYDTHSAIGKLTDITESQCEEWVEWIEVPQYYRDYRKEGWQGDITAKESFFSKLEVDGICFSNPLGDFPTKHNTGIEYGMEYISKVASWEESQEEVWDKDRTWCFEVI